MKQEPGASGVFAAHEIGHTQGIDRPWCDVAEVADGRGHQGERAVHEPRTSTRSPRRKFHRSNDPSAASITWCAPRTGEVRRMGDTRHILITVPAWSRYATSRSTRVPKVWIHLQGESTRGFSTCATPISPRRRVPRVLAKLALARTRPSDTSQQEMGSRRAPMAVQTLNLISMTSPSTTS